MNRNQRSALSALTKLDDLQNLVDNYPRFQEETIGKWKVPSPGRWYLDLSGSGQPFVTVF